MTRTVRILIVGLALAVVALGATLGTVLATDGSRHADADGGAAGMMAHSAAMMPHGTAMQTGEMAAHMRAMMGDAAATRMVDAMEAATGGQSVDAACAQLMQAHTLPGDAAAEGETSGHDVHHGPGGGP